MNERIEQLALIAQKYVEDNKYDYDIVSYHHGFAYNEKFAELIIRECALVVYNKTGPKSALNVLEHFGVE